MNYLLHFTGLRKDFDEWERLGADGWNFDDLQYFLNRHEMCEFEPQRTGNECQSGDDMPKLSITSIKEEDSKLSKAFSRAENEMQNAFNPNITFTLAKFTSKDGKRHSVFHEYLRRAYKHKNLSIMVHGKVEKIELNENKEAISVIVNTKSRQLTRIKAKREIILAAGALHSPHILKLSGIGNESELKSVGLCTNICHHLPGVGENLFDHMNFPLFVSINASGASVTRNKILSVNEIYRYLIDGSGVLSTTAVTGTVRLDDYGMIFFGMGSTDEKMLKNVANYETETFRAFFPMYANSSQEGFTALNTCLQPRSRGTVKIDPNNKNGDPLIDPGYLKDDYDFLCIRNAVKLTMQMVSTKAFRELDATIHWPRLKACDNFGPFFEDSDNFVPSGRYLDCLMRHGVSELFLLMK